MFTSLIKPLDELEVELVIHMGKAEVEHTKTRYVKAIDRRSSRLSGTAGLPFAGRASDTDSSLASFSLWKEVFVRN